MGTVAGANEAEQTPQGAERTTVQAAAQTSTEPARGDGQTPPASTSAQMSQQTSPETGAASEQIPQAPGFGERGRMRRRARFLRKARELAYRDLGGLVFDLHRFGQRNDQLVLAKLATLRQIDTELRELEQALSDRRPVTVLREVGIAACPRCAAIHGSDDRFCPGCGLAFDTNADRPISTAPVSPLAPSPSAAQTPASAQSPAAAQSPASARSPAAAPTPASAPGSTQPSTRVTPPKVEPALPLKPTAAPVAAKPTASAPERKQEDLPEPDRSGEDEPTQILRPPAPGP
jgi:hypothetical protein